MMIPMINSNNIWLNLHHGSSRRIDSKSQFNIFWICDERGRYGLRIGFSGILGENEFIDKIKGVQIIKSIRKDQGSDLYLVLNEANDWNIFYSFCSDLIDTCEKCTTEVELIAKLSKRVRRWQYFLSESKLLSMTEIQQMGLFAELQFLKEILLPNLQSGDAILSWVGCDFDKQDFSLLNSLVEVKSYISSKGSTVKISSLHQLVSDIKPLFLFAFGLTKTNNGVRIIDVIHEINECLSDDNKDLFAQKLAQYGYIEGVTEEPFYRFNLDNVRAFAVTEDFPRIIPNQIKEQIVDVQYALDLQRCQNFRVEPLFSSL
jgi:hypothetical protein